MKRSSIPVDFGKLLLFLCVLVGCTRGQAGGPTAVFVAPQTIEAGHVFTVDATTSVAGTSPIARYTWDFGDGAISHAPTVNYSYGTGGTYELMLTVIDEAGLSASAQQTVQVTQIAAGTPPTAVIEGPMNVAVGESVTLRADNSKLGSNPISKFNWYAGDGRTSGDTIEAIFTISYTQSGTYTPMVTIFDNKGLSDSASMEIVVVDTLP